jgi:hypothetical protein
MEFYTHYLPLKYNSTRQRTHQPGTKNLLSAPLTIHNITKAAEHSNPEVREMSIFKEISLVFDFERVCFALCFSQRDFFGF